MYFAHHTFLSKKINSHMSEKKVFVVYDTYEHITHFNKKSARDILDNIPKKLKQKNVINLSKINIIKLLN